MITRTTRLPSKRKRPKMGIERAPKRDWPRHRKFVKTHRCCVPGCPYMGVPDCAHLRGVNNCGTSLKPPDWHTVPLCRQHHLQQEPIGPDAFGDRHGIDLWEIAAKLAAKSPDMQMRLAMMMVQLDEPAPLPPKDEPSLADLMAAAAMTEDPVEAMRVAVGEPEQVTGSHPVKRDVDLAEKCKQSPANDDTPSDEPIGFTWFPVTPGSAPEKIEVVGRVA